MKGTGVPAKEMSDGTPFARAVKRSVTIAGHESSVRLEPLFWAALEQAAAAESLPLNALIARIDSQRIEQTDMPGLASALRCWLLDRALRHAGNDPEK